MRTMTKGLYRESSMKARMIIALSLCKICRSIVAQRFN